LIERREWDRKDLENGLLALRKKRLSWSSWSMTPLRKLESGRYRLLEVEEGRTSVVWLQLLEEVVVDVVVVVVVDSDDWRKG
jgi:hypothetical protein